MDVKGIFDIFLRTPIPNLLIGVGLIFLLIGVMGNFFNKFKIDKSWRIVSILIGIILFFMGFIIILTMPPSLNTCKDLKIVKIVEAEDCHTSALEDCHTSGRWRAWAKPEFSNGQCINNEYPNGHGNNATFYFNFEGTGVIIVYRQDTWYGALTVEIDGNTVGTINQRGEILNKEERCFETRDSGKHSLILRGTEAGVITIDAIKVLDD